MTDSEQYTPRTEEVRGSYGKWVGDPEWFDRWLAARDAEVARAAAEKALHDLTQKVDLEVIANEWAGPDGSGHWSAGNGASAVLNMIYDERNLYRLEQTDEQ